MELCKSNSIGSSFYPPRVIEWVQVSREEADALLAKEMFNGYYWRETEDIRY